MPALRRRRPKRKHIEPNTSETKRTKKNQKAFKFAELKLQNRKRKRTKKKTKKKKNNNKKPDKKHKTNNRFVVGHHDNGFVENFEEKKEEKKEEEKKGEETKSGLQNETKEHTEKRAQNNLSIGDLNTSFQKSKEGQFVRRTARLAFEDDSKYDIVGIPTDGDDVEQPPSAEAGILPKHPFRMYVVGQSGSGKSNFMLNLLTNDDMYKDYFDNIIVISATAMNLDKSYQVLGLPEANFFPCDENVLERIMEVQEKWVKEHGKNGAPKTLLIVDDFISYKKFCNSPIFLKFGVMSRHWMISMMVLSQAYHRVPKSLRMQMSAIVYFKGTNKEMEVLAEDVGAPNMTIREFKRLIAFATDGKYDFLFVDINRALDEGRYRKGLTHVLI